MRLYTSLKLAQTQIKFSSNNTVCLQIWLSVCKLTFSLTPYTLVLVLEVVHTVFFLSDFSEFHT